ncbi:MAG: plastocyanin/azurin family copper-binding protein, partial [Candidatus Eremiobacteraeota bacterium]|nr:plastocyanin/azurin family copper-binding protein [Candidatus Eremiobacteraeota bacterium]
AQSVLAFPYPVGGTVLAAGTQPGAPGGPPADSSVERFLNGKTMDPNVTVPVGGTLTWNNISQLPHTVTFAAAGQPMPPGPPFRPAAGGATYDGSTYTNSGLMPPGASYSLTFTKAGIYPYVCLFHGGTGENAEGMIGTVTVK